MTEREMTPSPVRRALRWDGVDVARRHELVRGAALPPNIQKIHDTYRPQTIPEAEWDEVADTARAWFLLAAPQNRHVAMKVMLLFARFTR